jgi:membrane associated rhomboid family serine protease/outer membrane protein assembly factor BamD (BamD/ComL family)
MATYALIGINVFVFLMTLVVANTNLPSDSLEGHAAITQLLSAAHVQEPALPDNLPANLEQQRDAFLSKWRRQAALGIAARQIDQPGGYKRFWQIEHADDTFVLEPHYSTLNTFAYRPGDPSPWGKLLGLFGSMFLHGGVEHIVGNMFFLWIFGRALEDVLGWKIYLGIYLTCGVAATLLFHEVTMLFMPQNANVPLMGASGAIAGLMGLFAVRFFRTKVRIFYLSLPLIVAIPGIGPLLLIGLLLYFLLWYLLFYVIIHLVGAALFLALVVFGISVFIFGRKWAWGAFRAPSIWVIAVYMLLFNVYPALSTVLRGTSGGTAYWAHIGGFSCGVLYALLIGGIDEGKTEYALEDARDALRAAGSENALNRAQQLLEKTPESAEALEIAARAYDQKEELELAAKTYLQALAAYWKSGDRRAAVRLYFMAQAKHPHLPLTPAMLAGMAGFCAGNNQQTEAAELLTRIIEEHPTAPEAEVALLRAAQMWLRVFDDPHESARLYALFLQLYPNSSWAPQARQGQEFSQTQARARDAGGPPPLANSES